MHHQLATQNQNIQYRVRLSKRARHMRIAVYCDSSVVVTLPQGFNLNLAEGFIKQKFSWIVKSLAYFKRFGNRPVIKSGRREYAKYKQQALEFAMRKVRQWNQVYNFSYARVNIKNQKTRWGSCSKKGNLNFNYNIFRLPEHLADYLIVHELCHLKEFNHSKNFWQLVAQTMPNYQNLRRDLRNFSHG